MPPTLQARAQYLDLFKTLLVWGMIPAHVVQLLGFRLGDGAARFSDYVNLVSFSGFMLAFGIGVGLSGRSRRPLASRLWPAAVMLASVYLSSLGFALLVERKLLTPELVIDVVTFRRLFGYSEFLASFFVLYLVIALARPLLLAIAERPLVLVLAIVLCLASTTITTEQLIPFAGTIIGHRRYASFPLLPYLPWFLAGIRLGRRDGVVPPIDLALAASATAVFGWFWWRAFFTLPERFPPSVLWIVGPALFLAVYLVAARAAADWVKVPPLLLAPGRHVLAALLLSNLSIFAVGRLWYKPAHPLWMAAAIALAILALVTLWCAGIDGIDATKAARRRPVAQPA